MKLNKCPICGREPKIIRDYGYEAHGFGAWCTIRCKRFFKTHMKVEEGKATWDRALQSAIQTWNERTEA